MEPVKLSHHPLGLSRKLEMWGKNRETFAVTKNARITKSGYQGSQVSHRFTIASIGFR